MSKEDVTQVKVKRMDDALARNSSVQHCSEVVAVVVFRSPKIAVYVRCLQSLIKDYVILYFVHTCTLS